MKKIIIRINSIILIGLITVTMISDLCLAQEEHHTIYVNEHIYFHTDNATFNVTGNIPFYSLTRTNDYMEFNFTRFYVTGTGTNITLDFLNNNMTITTFNKLVSFNNTNTSWFNITGFIVGDTYSVYINSTFFVNTVANVTGVINFTVANITSVYVEIYYFVTPTPEIPGVIGDINTTLNVYITMYMVGFLLFMLGIFRRNLTFTGCSFVLFIILWVQSINISVPFIAATDSSDYVLGNQQHLDPAVGASCWLFIIINILIMFYYFLGWWARRRGDEPAMP